MSLKRLSVVAFSIAFTLLLSITLFLSAHPGKSSLQTPLSVTNESSQPAYLLKDIREVDSFGGYASSLPYEFVTIGDDIYFTAYSENTGGSIIKSDGTPSGTFVLKGHLQGYFVSPFYVGLTEVDGEVFFSFNDGSTGSELWKTDGTVAGTTLVADINKTSFDYFSMYSTGGSNPGSLIEMNDILYFRADDGIHGRELWRSDGTFAGTQMIKNINTMPLDENVSSQGHSTPADLVVVNNMLFFTANDGINGKELWKSDGTEAGTMMVKDINPTGDAFYSQFEMAVMDGVLYFQATDGQNGMELWKSDGTENGTVPVLDINQGPNSSDPVGFSVVNQSVLYFAANDGIHGNELWKSDGTSAGTTMVKDINGNSASSLVYSWSKNGVLGDEIYFAAKETPSSGIELWKSDGTSAGTMMVKDIRNGSGSSYPAEFVRVNDTLFFTATDATYGKELWRTDGTESGTTIVVDLVEGSDSAHPEGLAESNGRLLFSSLSTQYGQEPFITDGTAAGTHLVADLVLNVPGSFIREGFTKYNDQLFFAAMDDEHGLELWMTDATSFGTEIFMDISPGNNGSDLEFLTVMNDELYFSTGSLWKSDGTVANTSTVSPYASPARNLYVISNTLYFVGGSGVPDTGRELWKSDGTESGTDLVKDIYPGPDSSYASNFVEFNGELYFSAENRDYRRELWKSDGTEDGTVLVKDIHPSGRSSPVGLTVSNNKLFFVADDDEIDNGLWVTDGTYTGTIRLHEVFTKTDQFINYYSDRLQPFANGILFAADDGIHGSELWFSDGTIDGTTLLADIWEGPEASFPRYFVTLNNLVYFVANEGIHGYELWVTDGTEAGTRLFNDFYPGVTGTLPMNMTVVDDLIFFAGISPQDGFEPWVSDGTISGTQRIQDICPGICSSRPGLFASLGDKVVFTANDGVHGTEPWAVSTLANLLVSQSIFPEQVGENAPFAITTVITNTGLHVVPTTSMTMTLPIQFEVLNIDAGVGQCNLNGSILSCTFSNTYMNSSHTVIVEGIVSNFMGTLQSSVMVSGDFAEVNLENNNSTLSFDIVENRLFLPILNK